MMHWYDDGYIVTGPLTLAFYVGMIWVLVFRPAWVNKFWPYSRITPGRMKAIACVFLIAMALAIFEFSLHVYRFVHP